MFLHPHDISSCFSKIFFPKPHFGGSLVGPPGTTWPTTCWSPSPSPGASPTPMWREPAAPPGLWLGMANLHLERWHFSRGKMMMVFGWVYIYMYRWVDDDVVTHGNWLNLIAVDWWEGVIGTRLDCFLKKGENYRNFSDLWTTLEVVAAKMQCHMVKFVGWLPLWCSGSTGWFSVFFWCTAFSETLLQGLALLEQRLRRFHSESQEVSRLGWNRRGYQQGQQGQRLGRDDGFTLR